MSGAQPNELGELGNIFDAGEVFAQIENTLRLFTPEHDLARIVLRRGGIIERSLDKLAELEKDS